MNFSIILKGLLILRSMGKIKKNDIILATLLNYNPKYNQTMLIKHSFLEKSQVSKALSRLQENEIIKKKKDGTFIFNETLDEKWILNLIQEYMGI